MVTFFKMLLAGVKTLLRGLMACVKVIYGVLKLLHLRLLALYLAVCGLLQLIFRAFDGRAAIFWVGFGAVAVLTVWSFVVNRRRRPAPREMPETVAEKEETSPQTAEPAPVNTPVPIVEPAPKYPLCFQVEGRADYFFLEYADRYELYKIEGGGGKYVRTDYKR